MVAELLASVPLNRVLLWFLSTKRMRHGREPSRTPSRSLCGTTQKDSYLELEFVETGFDSRSESSSGSGAVTGEASENGSRGPSFRGTCQEVADEGTPASKFIHSPSHELRSAYIVSFIPFYGNLFF